MAQSVVEELSEAQCYELVGQEIIARFVFQDEDGPVALPVNFGLAGRDIVFRTEIGSHFRAVMGSRIAIEVDHTDRQTGEGWSVLLRGTAREVDSDAVPGLLEQMGEKGPHPWAEGVHNLWVAVTPDKVTGRRLTMPFFTANF